MTMDSLEDLPDGVNYDLIEDGLYLGNLSTAVNIPTLTKLKISHILTVASEPLPNSVVQQLPHVNFLYINVDDVPGSDLLSHFECSCKFIAEAQEQGGAVLVHCYFGVSRSATLVAAHLMKRHRLDRHQAIDRIRARRQCVGPNVGFLHQLDVYHALGWSLNPASKQTATYRLYVHKMLCAMVRTEPHRLKEFLAKYLEKFKDDPPVNRNPGLSCRACRTVLCSRESVLPHRRGCWPALRSSHPRELCRRSFYMTAQPWMYGTAITSKLVGHLLCPKCGAQLGQYHWLKDLPCSCRQRVPCVACAADAAVDAAHFCFSASLTC